MPVFTPKKFQPVSPANTAAATATQVLGVPDIIEPDGANARPTIAGTGASGTGKTEAILHFLAAGYSVLLLDVESKYQQLMQYANKPKVIPINAPVENKATGAKRPPSATEKFQRMQAFKDRLGEGKFREVNGRPIDILAVDGAMELAEVYKRHYKANTPVSQEGAKNTYALYDKLGTDVVDFIGGLKDAASAGMVAYGMPPLGIYVTCGEQFESDNMGGGNYKLILPGRIAPRQFPFQFEAVFHLATRRGADGSREYVLHTAGDEGIFLAKAPGGFLTPEVSPWNMADIYRQLCEYYQQANTPALANGGAVIESNS